MNSFRLPINLQRASDVRKGQCQKYVVRPMCGILLVIGFARLLFLVTPLSLPSLFWPTYQPVSSLPHGTSLQLGCFYIREEFLLLFETTFRLMKNSALCRLLLK